MSPGDYDPVGWTADALAELEARGLRRTVVTRQGAQGPEIELAGQRLLNFGSNDYLGLAADPRLREAAAKCAETEGWGSGASPLITGHSAAYAALETELAAFKNTEAALVFNCGFAANSGVVPALVDRGDQIFADAKNHASLIDGCRLSRATVHIYRHADAEHLRQLLTAAPHEGRKLIVTDSLFSMDGDVAPLAAIADLADEHGAMLMVDEAHATGVYGAKGSGLVEQLGLERRVPIRMGTLSKALGSAGGFVAGSKSLIEWLANRARSWVFSTALPAPVLAAALAALKIVEQEPARRQRLQRMARDMRTALRQQQWDIGQGESQIVPIYLGAPERTMALSLALRERGFLVPGIRPPSVPEGESLLRISLSYSHSQAQIERLIGALAALRKKVG